MNVIDNSPEPRRLGEDDGATELYLLDLFLERLESAARDADGPLDIERIRAIAGKLRADHDMVGIEYDRAFRGAMLSARRLWSDERENALGRILQEDVRHLVTDDGDAGLEDHKIPREALPPLFEAIRDRVSDAAWEEAQRDARRLFARIRVRSDDADESWKELLNHSEARTVEERLLVKLARAFDSFPSEEASFIAAVNERLRWKPPSGDRAWRFGRDNFRAVMAGLYAGLMTTVSNDEESEALDARYGEGTAERLRALFNEFD